MILSSFDSMEVRRASTEDELALDEEGVWDTGAGVLLAAGVDAVAPPPFFFLSAASLFFRMISANP